MQNLSKEMVEDETKEKFKAIIKNDLRKDAQVRTMFKYLRTAFR